MRKARLTRQDRLKSEGVLHEITRRKYDRVEGRVRAQVDEPAPTKYGMLKVDHNNGPNTKFYNVYDKVD